MEINGTVACVGNEFVAISSVKNDAVFTATLLRLRMIKMPILS